MDLDSSNCGTKYSQTRSYLIFKQEKSVCSTIAWPITDTLLLIVEIYGKIKYDKGAAWNSLHII